MISTALPTEYRGGVCTGPTTPEGDGIVASGPGHVTIISDKVFDWRDVPTSQQDEVISGVDGANVRLQRCVILGGIKAILAGNGDHPGNDMRFGHWEMEDCVIMGAGRRCPEAQDGTTVTMRRCWVHDWGSTFAVRSFGAWAHRGGKIIAEDCLFTQSSGLLGFGLLNTFIDLANHVGQSVNDYGLGALFRPRTYMPGICRALTADTGGQVIATRCYRNRRWISIDGCDPLIGRDKARAIVAHIETACADMRPFLGTTLTDFFDTITA